MPAFHAFAAVSRSGEPRHRRYPDEMRRRDRNPSVLKVLHLITPTGSTLGADTWVHAEIIKSLDRDDHELYVAWVPSLDGAPTPFARSLEGVDDVAYLAVSAGPDRRAPRALRNIVRFIAAGAASAFSFARLMWLIWRNEIDIIHTSDRPRDAVASVIASRLSRARSVVHVHVLYRDWMSSWLRWAIDRADARIAVSKFVRESLVESGLDAATTHVVLNSVDLGRWTPHAERDTFREELGIKDATPMVVSVCRLFKEKGPADLIRAIADVRRSLPDVQLVIVGGDDHPGAVYLAELEELVAELDLELSVSFTGRRSDVPVIMAAADVFAMPSFEEPFGLVFAEAMAMGVPVVALDNGGTKEVVAHGEHGLLSEPGDHATLAANLLTLLQDPQLSARLGEAGRRRVENEFTVERMAADTASVYRQIASGT